jgi:hypothetical protein
MFESSEPLKEGDLIYQKVSLDESVSLTVRVDFNPLSDHMMESQAVGIIRVYDNHSFAMLHQEIQPLSSETILSHQPTDTEKDYWDELIGRYANDM